MQKTTKPTMPLLIEDLGMMFQTINSQKKERFGLYKCYCGEIFKAKQADVKSKNTKSCGCLKKKLTHGRGNHRLYKVWVHMLNRCRNRSCKAYKNYGERGISVCERWLDIENFIEDMDSSFEKGLSIDRIDNDGNYEPSNCRWATENTQHRNTRILMSRNTSGYRGVFFHNSKKRWVTQIGINKKQYRIGSFKTALEAAIAYDKYVIENNLEHTINGVVDI